MDILFGFATALPIVAATGIGTVTAVGQGVSQQRKANEEAAAANPESRMLKFHLDADIDPTTFDKHSSRSMERAALLRGGIVVVRDDKLWIEERDQKSGLPKRLGSHPFTGFYLLYPDEARVPPERGLVSTITRDPPMLNWVYVDKTSYELKYANRSGSIEQLVGDYDWTDEFEDSALTFDGWEGFVAVEEEGLKDEEGRTRWSLYVDVKDDGLKEKKKGRRSLEVRLKRRIMDQEVNQWGIGQQGNIGFKSTREV